MSDTLGWVIAIYMIIAGLISLKVVRPPLINWYQSSSFFVFGKNPVDIFLKKVGYRLGFELFIFAISCVGGALGLWIIALKKKTPSTKSIEMDSEKGGGIVG